MPKISKPFVQRVLKFALMSGIATAVDFVLFRFVFYEMMPLFYAEVLAGFIGMTINFILQKKFVFNLNRDVRVAFALSLFSSVILTLLGGFVIVQLETIAFFAANITVAKILVIGMKFGLNFFIKQWIFERSLMGKSKDVENQE